MSLRPVLLSLLLLVGTGVHAGKSKARKPTATRSQPSSQARKASQARPAKSGSAKPAEKASSDKGGAEEAYRVARTEYYALKSDSQRRQLRHNWQSVASRFLDVAKKHPKSARAPDALFTAGQLLNELSRISRVDADLRLAITAYVQLIDSHPKHGLSDDASLALARIHLDRLNKPEDARRILQRGLARSPNGDMRGEMTRLLKSLGSAPAAPAPVVVAPPLVAAAKTPSKASAKEKEAAPESAPAAAGGTRTLLDAIAGLSSVTASTEGGTPVTTATDEPAVEEAAPTELAVTSSAPAAPVGSHRVEPLAPPSGSESLHADGALASGASDAEAKGEEGALVDSNSAQLPPTPPTEVLPPAVAAPSRPVVASKIRRVVIDPGHGGHDSGAVGKSGTYEKDVSLSISKKLAALLRSDGYEVVLTRQDDRFIPLDGRTQIANSAQGDLFLSIHCNSAVSRKLHGVETYTLNVSSDRYAMRLAARENAASEEGMNDLQFILADLNTKANTEDSTRLAQRVQESLVTSLRGKHGTVKDLGHKEALFYVLLGAKMPAILVETAFISNADEEKKLRSAAYQADVAKAIAQGIAAFTSGKRVAKID